jgi:futalosine hydrolase
MNGGRWLPVCAAAVESEGLADLGTAVLGVGKAAAAAGLARILATQRCKGVLLFGVCGAFPDRHRVGCATAPVRPGELCVVGSDRFGDEGVESPAGFLDLAGLGLGEVGPFAADERHTRAAAELLAVPIVRGCTVSTCSGTEAASTEICARTDAHVETMEGAAVALTCRAFAVPLVHVRCVSNWTGSRDRGQWSLQTAVATVQSAVRRLLSAFRGNP